MKKSLIMAILFSGLASAPVAAAAPYVSLSGGIGLPGEWKETNYSTDKLNSGIVLRDLENTDLPIIISSYCNVKTGELAYEDIYTEPKRHNS